MNLRTAVGLAAMTTATSACYTTTSCGAVPVTEEVGLDDETSAGAVRDLVRGIEGLTSVTGTLNATEINLDIRGLYTGEPLLWEEYPTTTVRHVGINNNYLWDGCEGPWLVIPVRHDVYFGRDTSPALTLRSDATLNVAWNPYLPSPPAWESDITEIDHERLRPGSSADGWEAAVSDVEPDLRRRLSLTQTVGQEETLVLDAEWDISIDDTDAD